MQLRDLIAPCRCLACRLPGPRVLCARCASRLVAIDDSRCLRCGCPTAVVVPACIECAGRRLGFISARAALVHDDAAASLLRVWKDHGLRDAGELLVAICLERIDPIVADAVVAVPGVPRRVRWRGVDPPATVAAALAEAWGIPRVAWLRRVRDAPQRGLDRASRRRNARLSFVAAGPVAGRVIVVDDVYTTGATAAACAAALRRAGASEVLVVTATRVVASHYPRSRRWATASAESSTGEPIERASR